MIGQSELPVRQVILEHEYAYEAVYCVKPSDPGKSALPPLKL